MTAIAHLAAGEVLPLVRSVAMAPDPLHLFTDLCGAGIRPGTLLLESGDSADRRSEKSLVVVSSALRITCHGRTVQVHALNENGRSILPWLSEKLMALATVEGSRNSMDIRFAAPERGDEERRMKSPSPVDVIRVLMRELKTVSGSSAYPPLVAGVFSYDLLAAFESLPPALNDELHWPDFELWLPDRMIWIHHQQSAASVVAHVFGGEFQERAYHDSAAAIAVLTARCSAPPVVDRPEHDAGRSSVDLSDIEVDLDDDEFMRLVETLKEHIIAGDVFQIVASRTFRIPCPDPVASYRQLRRINPSPYMFFVNGTAGILFGSSPETAVKVDGLPRRVEIRPIAGTRRRGLRPDGDVDDDLDSRMEADLRLDEKEVAEHMMLVDLARNDVARVSVAGTRRVDKLLSVERYSHVMHLVSQVSGLLRPDLDALHAYVASMNMGTLVGAPKIKAAELLRTHERTARGPYGGAVGYFTADGRMDTSIIIRSAAVVNGVAVIRAGAGIVYDSDPRSEATETRKKAQAVLQAIAAPEAGSATS
ncbi:MAG: anthranilate synthase component 1 [Acidobacteriota bacterium]